VVALAKLALMAAPLAWIFTKVDWGQVAERALHFGIGPFFATSLVLSLTVTVNGVRYHSLLRAHDASPLPSRRDLVWLSYVSLYLNQLPGGVAGDVVRAHRVRESVQGTATSLAVLLFERVCGLVALFVLATVGSLLMPSSTALGGYIKVSALATGAIAAIAVGAPWTVSKIAWDKTFLARFPFITSHLTRLRPPKRMAPLGTALLLSFVIHLMTTSAIVSFVHSMAPEVAIRGIAAVTPLAMLGAFIPLTPGGFGQREAIFVELYGFAGVGPNEAVAASLLWFSSSLVPVAIGLVLGTVERFRAPQPR
jgi:uncharacterized protein (TIRG00374 family)